MDKATLVEFTGRDMVTEPINITSAVWPSAVVESIPFLSKVQRPKGNSRISAPARIRSGS